MDKRAIEAKVAELTKPEAVKAGVLANEVSANIGTKVAEAEKKLTATNDSIGALQEQLRNAAPDSARANALQSEITRLEGKATEYRSQIESRSAQEQTLIGELTRAANPELYAKQQKEAEQRKAAAAAADAALTKKTAANPPPAAPAQPEVPKWKRGMTAAEEAELKSYKEYEAAQKRRAAEKKEQDKAAAAKAVEDQFKAKAQKITPDVIKTMTNDEVLALVNDDTFRYLDRKQKNALVMRNLEIRAGR